MNVFVVDYVFVIENVDGWLIMYVLVGGDRIIG